jgi:anti-repressor protein
MELQVFENKGLVPIYQSNEEKLVSAREIHEFLGSGYKFTDWIQEKIEKYGFEEDADYYLLQNFPKQTGRGGHNKKEYLLTIDTAKEIAMVENNDQGRKVRKYFIEVEKKARQIYSVPKSFSEALYLASELQKKIDNDRPKVIFADAVEASHTSILIGELAKMLNQNGVNIGQFRLFQWMRENGYLMRNKNIPTQKSMDLKLMEIKERTINNPNGSIRITQTVKVTGKGQQYFINKFLN